VLEEGCPSRPGDDGIEACSYCAGTVIVDESGAYSHTAECIWLRVEREVKV